MIPLIIEPSKKFKENNKKRIRLLAPKNEQFLKIRNTISTNIQLNEKDSLHLAANDKNLISKNDQPIEAIYI